MYRDVLKEITTLGRRAAGLHAAAGTLGAGAGDSVRLALLGIVFKSANLPESYPQARFCIWLRKNGNYGQVRAAVEAEGRDFRRELNDMYVSPLIARGLLAADPDFAGNERDARAALRVQFPKPKDITTDEFVTALQDTLAPDGEMPCTVIILDEVQQYIGDDTGRSFVVQEVVEACSKRFGGSPPVPGDGSDGAIRHAGAAAAARPIHRERRALRHRCRDRHPAGGAGETPGPRQRRQVDAGRERRRAGSTFGRNQDRPAQRGQVRAGGRLPLLPVRRRFWEHALRAVDRAGTAGQLRTQLRIVYDAIRRTADDPLGTVVPADFLFEEISANLLQSGVLLREVNETIAGQDDGSPDGRSEVALVRAGLPDSKAPP